MKKEIVTRSRRVTIRFTGEEYSKLQGQFKETTARKLSDYLRKVLLHQKITTVARDGSLDDLINELIQLRRELNALGNNFNQAVKRLHTLDRIQEINRWAEHYEKAGLSIAIKVSEIEQKMLQISSRW